jgi:type IV pilus assembly protein PilE
MSMMFKNNRGFNLIELMIVVTIVGILAAIAYPAYQDQMIASRRSDGQAALLNMSGLMEHYFTENNTYVGANPTALGITNLSQQGYYTVSVSASTASSYTLTATPVVGGPQASDTTCGPLTITNTNVKGPNPGTCWE